MTTNQLKPSGLGTNHFLGSYWQWRRDELTWRLGDEIFPQFANFELVMDHIIWKARPPTRIRSVLQSWSHQGRRRLKKKEVVKMDLPIIVIDVIFWSGALCKNVRIWGTGTLHCICQFWHDQENIKLHISMTSSSLFWITSKSTLTQCLKVHPKCLSLQHYERSKQQLISKIKVIGLFPPKIYIRTKLIPFGGKIQIFEVPIICWDIFVDFQTVHESWYGTTYLL